MKEKMDEFFKKRPGMKSLFQFPGTFQDYLSKTSRSISQREKSPLKQLILEESKRILGSESSLAPLNEQLETYPVISYADHLGLLNFKLLYNSNILYAELIKKLKLPYVVVFASGSVPMVTQSLPRGFRFKGRKFNFFGEKQSKLPVYLFQGKLQGEKKRGIDSFLISYDRDSLSPDERKFLEFLFFDCLELEKAAEKYQSFSDQLTFLNFKLWKYFFDESIRNSIPDLLYLQSNQIVRDFLIAEIKKKDSLVSRILFDPSIRKVFLRNFNGIACCWGENMGSHLFWGIIERRKKTRLTSLKLNETTHQLEGENIQVTLEPEEIINAIQANKILQTSFFDLLLITFIEGYLALGGFNQIEYQPEMQRAHIKSLKETGLDQLAEQFASRITDGFTCGMFPFNFDSAIDMIWQHNSTEGKFHGTLNRGLSQNDLDKMLNTKIKNLIAPAIDTMLKNISPTD